MRKNFTVGQIAPVAAELTAIAEECDLIAKKLKSEPLAGHVKRLRDAIDDVAKSSSNSWFGYQATVYYRGFKPPSAGDHFDAEWGLYNNDFTEHVSSNWQEVLYDDFETFILQKAGNADLQILDVAAEEAKELFDEKKERLLTILSVLCDQTANAPLEEIRKEAKGLTTYSTAEVVDALSPGAIRTRDSLAATQGLRPPHHIRILSRVESCISSFTRLAELSKLARRTLAVIHLQTSSIDIRQPAHYEERVFIGHGNSRVWKELRDFVEDRLHLNVEEFNREPTAGKSTKERLEEMLKTSTFAFLLMTAEDEHVDATLHARENVIHEVGLFQGKLGFSRAIVVLETGCQEFSNIVGLGQIRFPKGHIEGSFEEIRKVLEREGLIQK